MKQFLFCATFLTLLIAVGCDKDTNQLPDVRPALREVHKKCNLNGNQLLDVVFYQVQSSQYDSTWVYFRNLTSSSLTNISILIELCGEEPSYGSCQMLGAIHIDSLRPSDTGGHRFLATGINDLNADHINTGILAAGNQDSKIAGRYLNDYSMFELPDSSHYVKAKGYILADGSTTLRITSEATDTANFTVSGFFVGDTSFQGKLFRGDDFAGRLYLLPYDSAGNKKYFIEGKRHSFRLGVTEGGDGISSILFNLLKDN